MSLQERMLSSGQVSPLLRALRQEDNTRTGASAMSEFEGNYIECIIKKQLLMNLGAGETSLEDHGNGLWRISAQFPFGFNGQVTDFGIVPSIHELQPNVSQVPVYRSSKLRNYLTARQIGLTKRVIDWYQNSEYSVGTNSGLTKTGEDTALADIPKLIDYDLANGGANVGGRSTAQAKADAISLFSAVAFLGVEEAIEYYTVYRRTLTAATAFQVRASFTGVGKIWTTAEVNGFENLPSNGMFQLDPTKQWHKSAPEVVAIAGQKTQVVYTYTEIVTAFGLVYDAENAATLVYGPAA